MKKTIFLAMMSIFILLMAITAHGQPGFGPIYEDSQYANSQYAIGPYPSEQYLADGSLDQYSEYNTIGMSSPGPNLPGSTAYQTDAPSGAPAPFAPSSPDALRLNIPPETSIVDYKEAPATIEAEDALIYSSDFAPADFAATGFAEGEIVGDEAMGMTLGQQRRATSAVQPTYSSSQKLVISDGLRAKNKLYVSNVAQTTGACRLYGWLPMWLQISSPGPVWFYEWYPSGELRVKYLGYSSAGWNKKWFNGDAPGWHILQYHCNGWSNYIYIYVYGQRTGTWTGQGPYGPEPSRGTSAVTLRSSWLFGYDVYLDDKYIGTEGFGKDLSDGIYRFNVPGDMWHTIVITKDGKSYWETGTFVSGAAYRFTI